MRKIEKVCEYDGCTNYAESKGSKHCISHGQQLRYNGKLNNIKRPGVENGLVCVVCDKVLTGRQEKFCCNGCVRKFHNPKKRGEVFVKGEKRICQGPSCENELPPGSRASRKFCGTLCISRFANGTILDDVKCKYDRCGNIIVFRPGKRTPQFCSQACGHHYRYQNDLDYRERIKKESRSANRVRNSKYNVPGKIRPMEWSLIIAWYTKCLGPNCQEASSALTMDHVIPISRGGEHIFTNIQPLCRSCNASKGNQIIDYRSESDIVGVTSLIKKVKSLINDKNQPLHQAAKRNGIPIPKRWT